MKKLPIGIQTFETIRTDNYVYVDKTAIALELINNGVYYFLSRPRRFGKSLFLDTLKCIFEGKKELFEDLAIYDQWNWNQTHPVIKISFGTGVHGTLEDLDNTIIRILERNQKHLSVSCKNTKDAKSYFDELIENVYEKHGKVVILVDEYDKPILDHIADKETARIMRDSLKNLYSVIKNNDQYIKFVFITGVSKFSKVNLFSGLNNFQDITIDSRYSTICGYTHIDLQTTFKAHLKNTDWDTLKSWYNGYHYFGDKVYNPFDILLFIANGGKDYNNYWWSTGNPSFLIKLLESKHFYLPDLDNYEVDDILLDSFDVDQIEFVPLLWQTGYLTFKDKRNTHFGTVYRLTIPNREIQTSLNALFINYLTTHTSETTKFRQQLYDVLNQANLTKLEVLFKQLFASIPYNNFTNNQLQNYEGYYSSVVYAYLASLGIEIRAEDTTNHGRIDISLKVEKKIYLFEIKAVDKPTGKALAQIEDRQYFQKYLGEADVYCVGMEFCKGERSLCVFEWRQIH